MDHHRTALITGAAGALGTAFAQTLAAAGWRLALTDIDRSACRALADQLQATGADVRAEVLDVRALDQWESLRDSLRSDWQQLDLLVNNAGVCSAGTTGSFPAADWQWVIDVNLIGTMNGCHTLVPWLRENTRAAHIVNIASYAAFISLPLVGAYVASKAGVLAYSESLYLELARQNVSVTAVCPGFFPSQLFHRGRFHTRGFQQISDTMVREWQLSPEKIVASALRGMELQQLYVMVPSRTRWMWRLKRWFPLATLAYVRRRSQMLLNS